MNLKHHAFMGVIYIFRHEEERTGSDKRYMEVALYCENNKIIRRVSVDT
jgi:hypothetical protein